jgi:hypothetical protein
MQSGIELVSPNNNGHSWAIAFDCSLTWEQLIKHVETCLDPSGYQLLRNKDFKKYGGYTAREYISIDRKITIFVGHYVSEKSPLWNAYDTYVFEVNVWNHPF